MKKIFLFFALLPLAAMAQVAQIVGDWTTVDDKTGKQVSVVNIYKSSDGLYYGKITQLLEGPKDAICIECEGDDHNKPMQGMVIIRGMKEVNGELREGKVLDPNNGKFYYARIYLEDGNLILRGSLDKRGLLGRNQTWVR